MRMRAFANRNFKELIRDRLNLGFGLGFPVIMLLLFALISSNTPVEMFEMDVLTPGIAVFGLSFIALFSALLISKDRTSSLMLRLSTSPMTSQDFILGYTLPLIPLAVMQNVVCFAVAMMLGLHFTVNIFMTILVILPSSVLFISIGLLCGSVLNDKQVGGVCGALLTNLSAWLSGTWFDTKYAGKAFDTIAGILPFKHAVDAGRAALSGDYAQIFPDLWWVLGYAVFLTVAAVLIFKKKMNSDSVGA